MKLYLKKAEDMNIKDIINLRNFRKTKEPIKQNGGYVVCATCKTPFTIEGSNFCSHCGQKANWKNYWLEEERKEQIMETFLWYKE